jgi:hypothetical protein
MPCHPFSGKGLPVIGDFRPGAPPRGAAASAPATGKPQACPYHADAAHVHGTFGTDTLFQQATIVYPQAHHE